MNTREYSLIKTSVLLVNKFKEARLTVRQVAEKTGISRHTIRDNRRGTSVPSDLTIIMYGLYFGRDFSKKLIDAQRFVCEFCNELSKIRDCGDGLLLCHKCREIVRKRKKAFKDKSKENLLRPIVSYKKMEYVKCKICGRKTMKRLTCKQCNVNKYEKDLRIKENRIFFDSFMVGDNVEFYQRGNVVYAKIVLKIPENMMLFEGIKRLENPPKKIKDKKITPSYPALRDHPSFLLWDLKRRTYKYPNIGTIRKGFIENAKENK